MPPVERFVCRFAAEPPQEALPHGAWAQTLQAEFLSACLRIDSEGQDLGEARELRYFPDRTWNGRTYVPMTARTTTELELFGFVSFVPPDADEHGSEATRVRVERGLHRRDRRAQPRLADRPLRGGRRPLARRGRAHAPT